MLPVVDHKPRFVGRLGKELPLGAPVELEVIFEVTE
jgi:hypothetical protein